ITGGNGFQVYTNGGFSTTTNNITVHHNVIDGVGKHGINLADGTGSNVLVYDNLVTNTQFSGLRFNTVNLANASVLSNTFYNTALAASAKQGSYGVISNDWNLPAGSVKFVNNIFYASNGAYLLGGSTAFSGLEGTWSDDLWFNGADGAPTFATGAVSLDPLFVRAGSDFHLGSGSPAIGAGSSTTSSVVADDLYGTLRTANIDIGAVAVPAAAK
ncbi:MAG: right-handed parallel beta-helix repeat-containing protein, partial [Burkholderiales bacterium]|nr:right-handed parallel beta-helix repeat-containing protein [Burkholderiales bacterium]